MTRIGQDDILGLLYLKLLRGRRKIKITLKEFLIAASGGGVSLLVSPSPIMRRYSAYKNIRGPLRGVPMFCTVVKVLFTDTKVIFIAFPHELLQNISWAGIKAYKKEEVSFVEGKAGLQIIIKAKQFEEIANSLSPNLEREMIRSGFTNKKEIENFRDLIFVRNFPPAELKFVVLEKSPENIIYLEY